MNNRINKFILEDGIAGKLVTRFEVIYLVRANAVTEKIKNLFAIN